MPRTPRLAPLSLALAACFAVTTATAAEPARLLNLSQRYTPAPPWPAGDERGMANAVGPGTWARCAWHLSQPRAKTYELSHLRSATMPLSPFSGPYANRPKPTAGLPGTLQAFNLEQFEAGAEPAQQGTQIDALGHFAHLPQPWDGQAPFPAEQAQYYGGYTQKDVKPTPDSLLLRLGMEKAPPIVTSAVLLDARRHVGRGQPMKAGELVSAKHIEEMLRAQGLAGRGILAGDVVYVHTGWGEHWKDPDTEKVYYTMAPGLSYDAAQYLGQRRIVAIGLDTPFVDPAAEGFLAGKAGPAAGTPPGIPFAVHHHMLTQLGIHHIENAKLDELARDRVWTSCAMILPLREQGSAGSAIRPVSIGTPGRESRPETR
ncbi:MAG: cyclase family protein [Betaproteobacteria bacterium]|nr:MAG: cyclase family protein [Betaproteobacteria bacterium]